MSLRLGLLCKDSPVRVQKHLAGVGDRSRLAIWAMEEITAKECMREVSRSDESVTKNGVPTPQLV